MTVEKAEKENSIKNKEENRKEIFNNDDDDDNEAKKMNDKRKRRKKKKRRKRELEMELKEKEGIVEGVNGENVNNNGNNNSSKTKKLEDNVSKIPKIREKKRKKKKTSNKTRKSMKEGTTRNYDDDKDQHECTTVTTTQPQGAVDDDNIDEGGKTATTTTNNIGNNSNSNHKHYHKMILDKTMLLKRKRNETPNDGYKKRIKEKTNHKCDLLSNLNERSQIALTNPRVKKVLNSTEKNSKLSNNKPLNGLTIAVSTLGTKGEPHLTPDSSYQSIVSDCKILGAIVTPQVHKRVFAVICNESAVKQMTQRVRKALKKNIPIVSTEWIRECKGEKIRISHEPYLLNDLSQSIIGKRKKRDCASEIKSNDVEILNSDEIACMSHTIWSKPIELECCCSCHETDRLDCKWCQSCNVNILKKSKN